MWEECLLHLLEGCTYFSVSVSLRLSISRDSAGIRRRHDDRRDGHNYREEKRVAMNNGMGRMLIKKSWDGECSQLGGELEELNQW